MFAFNYCCGKLLLRQIIAATNYCCDMGCSGFGVQLVPLTPRTLSFNIVPSAIMACNHEVIEIANINGGTVFDRTTEARMRSDWVESRIDFRW